jgi:hypothetical protein
MVCRAVPHLMSKTRSEDPVLMCRLLCTYPTFPRELYQKSDLTAIPRRHSEERKIDTNSKRFVHRGGQFRTRSRWNNEIDIHRENETSEPFWSHKPWNENDTTQEILPLQARHGRFVERMKCGRRRKTPKPQGEYTRPLAALRITPEKEF